MKHLIKPKNREQEEAIAIGRNFLDNGKPDEWFCIVGKAGTGKTTIVQAILEPYVKSHKILVCALSHKAKLVLAEKLIAAFKGKNIITKSVAGALGMNMDDETGKFILNYDYQVEQPIKTADIIIVDEASMINEDSHYLIMSEKRKDAKVIYLGDVRQLPPIREGSDINSDKPSPTFYTPNRAILNERIRQGEESPILPFADYFGNNSRIQYPVLNPVPTSQRNNIVTDKGAIVFVQNTGNALEAVFPLYDYAVANGDMNIVKTVCYRNDTRKAINVMVRFHLFGDDSLDNQFVKKDLLMFQDNFSVADLDEPLSNSYEIQVTNVNSFNDGSYEVWELEFIYESKPIRILVLDKSQEKRHSDDVSRLFQIAKAIPFGDDRKAALAKAWQLKRKYAPVDYAYAITSHKAQGSTYNTVIVEEKDICSVRMISNKAKSQSMYTAITRASTTCIVVDGQPANEKLQAAVSLSIKTLNIKETVK